MNTGVGRARIGQWYLRWDKGEIFQVTGFDGKSRIIETQTFDGDPDEIDEDTWTALPLGLAEPPEDWAGPADDVEVDNLEYSETELTARDWSAPVQSLGAVAEEREDTTESDEPNPEGEGVPIESFVPDEATVRERLG